jgi:hypothetical protein
MRSLMRRLRSSSFSPDVRQSAADRCDERNNVQRRRQQEESVVVGLECGERKFRESARGCPRPVAYAIAICTRLAVGAIAICTRTMTSSKDATSTSCFRLPSNGCRRRRVAAVRVS